MLYEDDEGIVWVDCALAAASAPDAAVIPEERASSPPAFVSARMSAYTKEWNELLTSSPAAEVKSVGRPQWTGRIGVASRFVNFCGRAFAPLTTSGAVLDADAWRIAVTHDADAPKRVIRFLLGVRLGESSLVGGSGRAVSAMYVKNIRGYLGWFFGAARVGLFDGDELYSDCVGVDARYLPNSDGVSFCGSPTTDGRVVTWLTGMAKNAVAHGEFQERQPPVDPDLLHAIYNKGMDSIDAIGDESVGDGHARVASAARVALNLFLNGMAWATMLRPENLLSLLARDVTVAPPSPENDVFYEQHGHARFVTVQYRMLKTHQDGASELPQWRFYSLHDLSSESAARPMSTRCLEPWNNIPELYALVQICVEEMVGDSVDRNRRLFLSLARPRQQAAARGAIIFSSSIMTKAAFQDAFAFDIHAVMPERTLADFGGLYGFRRRATQYWLEKLGDVETVMRMGLWRPDSPRFLRYLINLNCSTTLRTSLKDFHERDEAEMCARLDRAFDMHLAALEQDADEKVVDGDDPKSVIEAFERHKKGISKNIIGELYAHAGKTARQGNS